MSERTQVTGLLAEVRGEAGEVVRVSAPRAAHRHDLLGDQKPGEDRGRGREGEGGGGVGRGRREGEKERRQNLAHCNSIYQDEIEL